MQMADCSLNVALCCCAILLTASVANCLAAKESAGLKDNSAHLTRIRQLRQRNGQLAVEEGAGDTSSAGKGNKPKRYKCYLVDEDDEAGPEAEGLKRPDQQKSYFRAFQRRRGGGEQITGWQEGPRRSAGKQHYLYASSPEGGTSAAPIIEYVDYDSEGSTPPLVFDSASRTPTPTTTATTPFTTTMQKVTTVAKQHFKIKLSPPNRLDSNAETAEEGPKDEDGEEEEEYTDGGDLYISTTLRALTPSRQRQTASFPRAQGIIIPRMEDRDKVQHRPSSTRLPLHRMSAKAALVPPRAIAQPTESKEAESESVEAEDEEAMERRLRQEMEQQAKLVRITASGKGEPDAEVPGSTASPRPQTQPPPRDAQGRPLVLSPEHCRMVDQYSRLYGVRDVRAFVRNNCAFAKVYLPMASCAEIDILVGSCYQRRPEQQPYH